MKYLIVCAAALAVAGCEDGNETNRETDRKYHMRTFSTVIYSIEIEGHQYIIFDGSRKGGIIHSESCLCKKSGGAR